jgi:hypothetical protein
MYATKELIAIETAVEAMDEQPSSIELLRKAVEMIAAETKTKLVITLEPPYLRAHRGPHSFNAKIEEHAYRFYYMCQGDSWDAREDTTSVMAWKIVGMPRPKAIAPATERNQH